MCGFQKWAKLTLKLFGILRHDGSVRVSIFFVCSAFRDGSVGGANRSANGFVELIARENKVEVFVIGEPSACDRYQLYHSNVSISHFDRSFLGVFRALRKVQACDSNIFYFNSFFEPFSAILFFLGGRSCNVIRKDNLVVFAPKGEFFQSALRYSFWKKWIYLNAVPKILFRSVRWHASNSLEKEAIQTTCSKHNLKSSDIVIASEVPQINPVDESMPRSSFSGTLSLVSVGRIHPIKNLEFAIQVLKETPGEVELSILGPVEDGQYFEWLKYLSEMQGSIEKVTFLGSVPPDEVVGLLGQFDVLLHPSFSENYCHVVPEALSAGCCVIMSDGVPWEPHEDFLVKKPLVVGEWVESLMQIRNLLEKDREIKQRINRYINDHIFGESLYEDSKKIFL